METKDNRILRNTSVDEFIGDAIFGAVALYPDFAVADFDMDQASVVMAMAIPTFGEDGILVCFRIKGGKVADVDVGLGDLGIGLQDGTDDLAVVV